MKFEKSKLEENPENGTQARGMHGGIDARRSCAGQVLQIAYKSRFVPWSRYLVLDPKAGFAIFAGPETSENDVSSRMEKNRAIPPMLISGYQNVYGRDTETRP